MITLFFVLWGLLVASFLAALPWFRFPSKRVQKETVADLSMVTAA